MRAALPFRAVNRRDDLQYRPGLQRHHLLPRQLLGQAGLRRLIGTLGPERIGFEDFRRNGLLLPCDDGEARRIGLPLHRGPHRSSNAMVIERIGAIEMAWQRTRRTAPDRADRVALEQIDQLQRAMRRHLLDPAGWRMLPLHRRDPSLAQPLDFTALDAMAEMLWSATAPLGKIS